MNPGYPKAGRRASNLRRKRRDRLERLLIALLCAGAITACFFFVNSITAEAVAKNSKEGLPASDGKSYSPADTTDGAVIHKAPDVSKAPEDTANQWQLVLVNGKNPLSKDYVPPLAAVGQYKFDERAADALKKMLADARTAGLSPIICSAYRSYDKQMSLYNSQVSKQAAKGLSYEKAREEAKKVVACPGTSEHNLGLAADIVSKDYQLLDDAQAQTPEAQWLKDNCYKYGFIPRYPPDKSDITGIIFEPWHYRYVGVEAATYITENNLCLEEYLNQP
ncbi:D-alanyl-D-alanine carboxypeptidase [Sporobacter termitidis DSM 10068]|uniref:D-alanyl-D-alanine carboxypeptidase n=1 Tax=Sporobacter termitidis DSM 10068 TaxID=1123282 RepID=A0A1M5VF49_9FIRM|nr:M15 family metallopeptidase [Sporobacter termitidis]SHH73856.1 D-alanyl-D-alanine carboxypeptidase [Sporobacter termitidis DSM 10068]